MLIGCVVYMINPCTLSVIARLAINKYLIAAERRHLLRCIGPTMLLVSFPMLIHFSFLPLSFSAIYSLKRGSQMPHQQGLPFITCWIHCSPFFFSSFISLTISQESLRHYATRWNTITSLSHSGVVMKASSVFQQRSPTNPMPPPHPRPSDERERDTVTSFLCQATDKSHCGWLVHL